MAKADAKVKFRVDQVSNFVYGQVVGLKHVHGAGAPEKGKKEHENNTFAKEIPAATLEMQIEKGAPQYGKFEPGDEFYVEFTKCK